MAYSEDELLMLSGIQHFMFCARQWAFIDLEQVWSDNRLTAEGSILHSNVDNPYYRQSNNGVLTIRGFKITSLELGLYGIADAIELVPETDSAAKAFFHPSYPGRWRPRLVEYKHGRPKFSQCDEVQVVAQAICLEEMYGVHIDEAFLFYFETRRRERVVLTSHLRELTRELAKQMHSVYKSGILPKIPSGAHCRNCSLKDLCMPELGKCKSVSSYLQQNLYAEIT